jgi:hypothetical protein
MRGRDVIVWLVCSFLTVGLLVAGGLRLDYINAQREEMKLISNEPLENAPPSLAFATVAMGAFRGLVVDVLWIRADKLKEEGQFFDAKQLAEWITMLQPRFASVWEFHAWNMAYNISVTMPASQPEQRWRWVKNGYELLRDKGIPLNPKSIQLYRELGWIFQQKIGGVTDDAHKYYKLQLAEAMEPLVGGADNQYFEALVAAPKQWEQIAGDPEVKPLIEALKSADDKFESQSKFVDNYLSLRQNPHRFKTAAFEVIDEFRGSPALKRFDVFAKAFHLTNTWKLEPVLMQELNKTYGPIDFAAPNKHFPLDWRHADSHAIYWAVKALKVAAKEENREIDLDETNTDRMVGQSLQNLFRYGKILIYDVPAEPQAQATQEQGPAEEGQTHREIFLRPDLRMFDPYNKAELAILEKYKNDRGRSESLRTGHRNMLRNAALVFYQAGHKDQATKIYNELRKLYPIDDFKVPLDVYARNRFIEELDGFGIQDATEQITAVLRESYYLYGIRSDDEAAGREKLAEELYEHYRKAYGDEIRIDLPEMRWLRYAALIDFLNDQQHPLYLRRALLARMKIERPDLYKQFEQVEEELRPADGGQGASG